MKYKWHKIEFRKIRRGLVSFCFFGAVELLFPTLLFSQAQNDSIKLSCELDEVQIEASRLPNEVLSAIPIQVLSQKKIEKLGFQSVGDAMKHFSSTTVTDYGGLGGLKTVSVQSLGAHHTAVAYDDVVVSNCQVGQVDIGRFSLNNIGALTVSIGQSDNLLQSAQLYGSSALLNIYSKRPLLSSLKPYAINTQLKVGSFGEANAFFNYSQCLNSGTILEANVDYLRSDGYYKFTIPNGDEPIHSKRRNSDIQSFHTEFNLYHTINKQSELHFKSYYFSSERGLPGAVIFYRVKNNKERLWDENYFAQINYTNQISNKLSFKLQGKYNYAWNKHLEEDAKYPGGKQIDRNRQNEYYFSGALHYRPLEKFSIALAQDAVYNTLENNFNEAVAPTRWTSYTALNMKYQYRNITLKGGVLNTHMRNKKGEEYASQSTNKLTPSFSISCQPFADEQLTLRLLYKKSYRLPTFNDLYYKRIGSVNLRPELATEYNVGASYAYTQLNSWIDYFKINLNYFHNRVSDKIVAYPSVYLSKMVNFGEVKIDGVDLNFSSILSLVNNYNLTVSGGLLYQKSIDVTDDTSQSYKDQLPYTPKWSGNGSLILGTPYGGLTYSFVAVGERYFSKQNVDENRMTPFIDQKISYNKSFNISTLQCSLTVECLNFMNKQYDIIVYYPMPGRSFKTTLTLNF